MNSPMKLLIVLKMRSSGKIKINNLELQEIAKALKVCTKTVRNNLNKLQDLKWVGYNPKSKYYHIKSFQRIKNLYDYTAKTVALFHFKDVLKIKEFIAAASIGILINHKIKTNKKLRRAQAGGKASRSTHSTSANINSLIPVANKGLAMCWKKSKSYAYNMKVRAEDAGFIEITKMFSRTGMKEDLLKSVRQSGNEYFTRAVIIRDEVVFKMPDRLSHSIELKFKGKRPLKSVKF